MDLVTCGPYNPVALTDGTARLRATIALPAKRFSSALARADAGMHQAESGDWKTVILMEPTQPSPTDSSVIRFFLAVQLDFAPPGRPEVAWNRANHPDQVRLREDLDDTRDLVAASRVEGPCASRELRTVASCRTS